MCKWPIFKFVYKRGFKKSATWVETNKVEEFHGGCSKKSWNLPYSDESDHCIPKTLLVWSFVASSKRVQGKICVIFRGDVSNCRKSYRAYKTKVVFSGNGDISCSRAVNKKVSANTKQMLWLSESFTFCTASAKHGSTLTKSFLSCFSSPL